MCTEVDSWLDTDWILRRGTVYLDGAESYFSRYSDYQIAVEEGKFTSQYVKNEF